VRDSTVVFLQGGGAGAHAEDQALASSLESLLGAGYHVRYPAMPGEGDPDYGRWKPAIARELDASRGDLFLVAHSVGAPMLLRYLAEEQAPEIAGLFLIAPPYLGPGGWSSEGWNMEELLSRAKFTVQVSGATPVFLYHSRDDRIVPLAHLALYAEQLPQATLRTFDGRGHQLENDLTEVARDIRACAWSARSRRPRRRTTT
jgi:predicted alpha/beta hydrolase family esterase